MPGLFDNIQLPEEDKDKTAEIPKDEEDTTTVAADTSKQDAKDKNADDSNADKDKPDPTKADDKNSDGSDKSVETAPDPNKDKEEDKDKDKAPPFHEHPDWIKREQQLKEKELEVAKLQGQIEVLEKKSTPEAERETKKVERQRAAVVAEQKVIEKINSGWKPKDVLEQQRVYSEFFEEELDARAKEKDEEKQKQTKEFNETRDRIAAEVATIYKDSGVATDAEKKLAEDLALKWANEGTANWSTKTLQLAIEHLKLEGKIGKVSPPTPVPVKDDNKDKDNKDDVNRKIAKSNSKQGDPANGAKKSYKNLVKKSLDDIVLEQSEALG